MILLDKIGELEILNKLFGTIITTDEVSNEFGLPLPSWIKIQNPTDKIYQTIIEVTLDKGRQALLLLQSN